MTSGADAQKAIAVLQGLRSDPVLLHAASDAVRNVGPASEVLPEDEIKRHIDAILLAVLALATGDPAQIAAANTVADDLVLDRLEQGISLDNMLHGVRSARALIVERLIVVGSEAMDAASLLALIPALDAFVGDNHDRMVMTYRNAERKLARTEQTTRVEALRELLGGGSARWAAEAGLHDDGSYYCLLADVSIPKDARRLESLWGRPEGVSAIVQGYLCRVTPELPSITDAPYLIVVSPRVPVGELPHVYGLCVRALDLYRAEGVTGPQQLLDASFAIAAAGLPRLGTLLARDLLGDLDPADDFHRLLARSALVFLSCGKQNQEASAILHVHPNTLRYRLRRFGEIVTPGRNAVAGDAPFVLGTNVMWALTTWLEAETVKD